MKHIVLDQNVLRGKSEIEDALNNAASHGDLVLLPDIAVAEMMKSAEWESTSRHSLRLLAEAPGMVAVSYAVGPLMLREYHSETATDDVVDLEVTRGFRDLLAELHSSDGPRVDQLRQRIVAAQAKSAQQIFSVDGNLKMIAGMVKALKADLTADQLLAVRRREESAIRDILASADTAAMFWKGLVDNGFNRGVAMRFSLTPSISSHALLGLLSLAIRWLDSLDNAKPKTIVNDIVDMDYVVTATFCRDIRSKESTVHAQYERLRSVIEKRKELLVGLSLDAVVAEITEGGPGVS